MHHDMDNTASQDGMQGTRDIEDESPGDQTSPDHDSSAPEEGAGDYYAQMIDHNLETFRGQFRRLKEAIEEHIRDIERGKVEDKGVNDIIKRFDPLLNNSMLQETKIHEKLAERLGQAGKHAVDLGCARIEIGRRLARLRDAAGDA
jgi:hypothetical protein